MDPPAQQQPSTDAPGLDGQVPALVPQQLCALVAAAAARTASSLGASPSETAFAVAQAIQSIAVDATRLGYFAPTPAPTAPALAPDVSLESCANNLDASSPDVSSISHDASDAASTYASTNTSISTGASYANSTDTSNIYDASAFAQVLTKRQRRRHRYRQHHIQQQVSTAPAPFTAQTPSPIPAQTQYFDISLSDVPCGTIVKADSVHDRTLLKTDVPDFLISDHSVQKFYEQPEDGRTLSDSKVIINDCAPVCRFIYSQHRFLHKYATDDRDYNLHKNYYNGDVPDFLIRHYLNDHQMRMGSTVDDEDGRTLTDYNIQNDDYNSRDFTSSFVEPATHSHDSRTHPRICESHESHDSDEGADNHERILSDHNIQNFNESHESDENSLASTHSDHSIQNVNNLRASFIEPAVPPVVGGDGADPGAASRCSWCLPAVPPRPGAAAPFAAHGPEVSARSELTELTEYVVVLACMIKATESEPSSSFRNKELTRLNIELQSIQFEIRNSKPQFEQP